MSDREQIVAELEERARQLKADLDANGIVAPHIYTGPELVVTESSRWEIPLFFLGLISVATLIAWLLICFFGAPVIHDKEILQPACYNMSGKVDCNVINIDSKREIGWEKR